MMSGAISSDMKEHIVSLTDEARQQLQQLVQSGTRPVRVVRRALVLLKSDEGFTDEEIVEHLGCSERMIRRVRKRFCTAGIERALYDAPRSGAPAAFTARQRQLVVALACSEPPEGRVRWTLELLCRHAAEQGIVESVSKSEVALWLKEHDLKPWRKKLGAFPSSPRNSASGWRTSSTSTSSRSIRPSR
jgi:transposase